MIRSDIGVHRTLVLGVSVFACVSRALVLHARHRVHVHGVCMIARLAHRHERMSEGIVRRRECGRCTLGIGGMARRRAGNRSGADAARECTQECTRRPRGPERTCDVTKHNG